QISERIDRFAETHTIPPSVVESLKNAISKIDLYQKQTYIAKTESLYRQMLEKIWHGPERWLFIIVLTFNVVRLYLLYIVRSHEMASELSGLPSDFSFARYPAIKRWYLVVVVFSWFNILAVLYHTHLYFSQQFVV